MGIKSITLDSGNEGEGHWFFSSVICENGSFHNKGLITVRDRKHLDENIERTKKWSKSHKEERRIQTHNFYKNHIMEERARLILRGERRKHFKSKGLNDFFEGSEGHHVTPEEIINIPKELHRSIPHNIFSGKNMDKINAKAFTFLFSREEGGVGG